MNYFAAPGHIPPLQGNEEKHMSLPRVYWMYHERKQLILKTLDKWLKHLSP